MSALTPVNLEQHAQHAVKTQDVDNKTAVSAAIPLQVRHSSAQYLYTTERLKEGISMLPQFSGTTPPASKAVTEKAKAKAKPKASRWIRFRLWYNTYR